MFTTIKLLCKVFCPPKDLGTPEGPATWLQVSPCSQEPHQRHHQIPRSKFQVGPVAVQALPQEMVFSELDSKYLGTIYTMEMHMYCRALSCVYIAEALRVDFVLVVR